MNISPHALSPDRISRFRLSWFHKAIVICIFAWPVSANAQWGIQIGSSNLTPVQTSSVEFTYLPLDYFQAFDQGNSTINAYLLTHLSDAVYAHRLGVDPQWGAKFKSEMQALGAVDAGFYSNTQTGAEVGVVETANALIIVHRGSSGMGTPINKIAADWLHDIDDDAIQKSIGGVTMNVHEGFWNTQSSVHWYVRWKAMDAHRRGKRIWVTGHSLGRIECDDYRRAASLR